MKKTVNSLFNQVSSQTLKNLTEEVKESIAYELPPIQRPSFTAADLWNIQRQARTRVQRRFL